MILINKIWLHVRTHGLISLLGRCYQKLRYKLNLTPDFVLVADSRNDFAAGDHFPGNFQLVSYRNISEIPSLDLNDFAQRKGGHKLLATFLNRFLQHGMTLWFLKVEGRLSSYTFIMDGTCSDTLLFFPFIPLSSTEAVILNGEVFPEFRGKRHSPLMIKLLLHELQKKGINRTYLSIKSINHSSIKALNRTAFRLLGRANHFKLPGRYVVVWRKPNPEDFN